MLVMTGATAGGLLGVPVRVHGIQLGHVADLVLDVERRRVLGLEVACGDEERRFLPLSVASVDEGVVRLTSALVLLNESELAFYTTRGSTFRALRGTTVARGRAMVGRLDDLVLADEGSVAGLIVDGEEVAYGVGVRLGAPGTDVRRAS